MHLQVSRRRGSVETDGPVPTDRPRISSDEAGLVMLAITEVDGSISWEDRLGNSNAISTRKA